MTFLFCFFFKSDLKAITPTIFAVFTLFGVLFIFCNFGELVTAQFERFNRRLYRYKWYSLTIEMQKMYLIFVANTQQPVILSSFARIECTRETLKKVNMVHLLEFFTIQIECNTFEKTFFFHFLLILDIKSRILLFHIASSYSYAKLNSG